MAAVALLLGSIAGCGGDARLTRGEFIKQADATCKRAKKAQESEIGSRSVASGDQARMVKAALEVLEIHDEMTKELARITPPEALEADYSAYLKERASENALAAQYVRTVGVTSSESASRATSVADLARRRDRAAHMAFRLSEELGFKNCSA